jgi:HD-GYP domain-containing protein (c-di-GMP phosphodiesterase class II)
MGVPEPPSELASLTRQLEELNQIGAALSAERDTSRLLELILTKAREITASDAGSLYVVEAVESGEGHRPAATPSRVAVEPARRLRFSIAQNDSIDVPFRQSLLEITDQSIAGYVALTARTVNLADTYQLPPDVPFTFNRSFDQAAGYRTRSILAVPMQTPKGHVVGVLQLINPKCDAAARLDSAQAVADQVVAFSSRQEALVTSLAAQAAVALENSQLYLSIQQLFEGFVRASVVAIEARDPATSGHSFRVANLTVALAEAVDRADSGSLADTRFSCEDMRTIRYASLLHDFGKVGVREEVLVKARKLYPAQLDLIGERFKLAHRSRQLLSMESRLAYLLEHGRDRYLQQLPTFDAELAGELGVLEQHLAAIVSANEPSVLPDGSFERLLDVASVEYLDVDGSHRPLLRDEEMRLLSLRKGSLSEAERVQIESHVVHTFRFLSQIPWTAEIRGIPTIAVGHHEKMNGTGYPYKLSAADIPIQARMMTIADIFDALSAADRPYKKAVPVERALQILEFAVHDGEIDPALFALFLEARVFDRWNVEPYPY